MITAEALQSECLRRRYARLLEQADTFPSATNWRYIIEQRMEGLGPLLYRKYLVALMLKEEQRSGLHTSAIRHFPEYLRSVSRAHALETVYGDSTTLPDEFVQLVKESSLFDAGRIKGLLESDPYNNRRIVARLLEAYQPEYGVEDLNEMKCLAYRLQSLEATGHIEQRRSLMGMQHRYICQHGHSSDADNVYCPECGLDIYGFNESHHKSIDEFNERIEALTALLDSLTSMGNLIAHPKS